MKFNVLNRFTGNIQFTADIDANEDTPRSMKIGLAVQWAIKENANLRYANLSGANLRYANLSGANLSGADLSDADLLIIQNIGSESGTLMAAWKGKDCRITRGCFGGSLDEFKAAVEKKHTGTRHYAEYDAAIKLIELRMMEGER